VNIVIVNLIRPNMVQRASFTRAHVMIVAAHEKTQSYMKHTSKNDIFPLAIENYDCLHSRFNSFLTSCA
jgi:hypothetical protein